MKKQINAVSAVTYTAGILTVSCAVIVFMLCILSALGLFEPKKTRITVSSSNISHVYSGDYISSTDPYISLGKLQKGHELIVTAKSSYCDVGTYKNDCEFIIADSSGADVTEMYDITYSFGNCKIKCIPITVGSRIENKKKRYDGTPLVCDDLIIVNGLLLATHTFVSLAQTSITDPGTVSVEPKYIITDQNGTDVTAMYDVTMRAGTITVEAIPLTVMTGSSAKKYDGTPLSNNKWELVAGSLLANHKLSVTCYTEAVEPGAHENHANAAIQDSQGNDVTHLYNVQYAYGILNINPLSLHISTGNATKEYDGTPLTNDTWQLVSGKLAPGESITIASVAQAFDVGTTSNNIAFAIMDKNGNDITSRYKIVLTPGTLVVTPRHVTIRTGSASKVYDGTALSCEKYEITKGSLCPGDNFDFTFTSITDIGYSDNYLLSRGVFASSSDGTRREVTKNYKITIIYGTLRITAD